MATVLPPTVTTNSVLARPIKPLLRRSTLSGTVRTRDEAGLDDESDISMTAPSSPSKRAKTVSFSELVDEQAISPFQTLDLDLESVRSDVRRAIEGHVRGIVEEGYDALKDMFRPVRKGMSGTGPSNDTLRANLLALTGCVSLLGKSCSSLVKLMLEFEWMGRDEGLVKVYVHFLGNLASAQGVYVESVLAMLVEKFTGSKYSLLSMCDCLNLTKRLVRLSSGRLPGCSIVSSKQLLSRVHMALRYLLRLIPSASSTLAPILSTKFPYSDKSKKVHISYIQNLLRIHEYAPELKEETFALVTERLVKIDVEMQVDLDDLDDEVTAAVVQAISISSRAADEVDEADDESDADSITSDDTVEDDPNQLKKIQDNVEKMDAILDLLFQTYTPYFLDPNSASAQSMFQTLLSHFRSTILPTYRSRHTQFLLFHFAQTSDKLVDEFAGECVDLAFKSGNAAILRQSASAYLASFVARGSHVPSNVVRDVFGYIGHKLDILREENEKTCRGPDLQRYGTFYATTQALLYIFCFRWRDFIATEADDDVLDDEDPTAVLSQNLEWRDGVRELLSRTIYSKLNPLKICAPPIVEEFAKIARNLRFLYIFPLIEKNKRVRLSQFVLGAGSKGGVLRDSGFGKDDGDEESWHQLDAYFPFDPYQLPVSARWIEGDYNEWKGIPGGRENEEGDSSNNEEDPDDLESDEENTATDSDDAV
jgi:RNA polymerase I-specific transcription initiation factor RRN3